MRSALLFAFATLAAACSGSSTQVCGDVVCPSSLTCIAELSLCQDESAAAICRDQADGAACTTVDAQPGACQLGACIQTSCGNGFVEAGEVCDDGNNLSADGCSAECNSDESCGNGFFDFSLGELCDDGNAADGDGCSSACEFEFARWYRPQLGNTHGYVVYDSSQDALFSINRAAPTSNPNAQVFFTTARLVGDTWVHVPGARNGVATQGAAYAPDRAVTLVIGRDLSLSHFDGQNFLPAAPMPDVFGSGLIINPAMGYDLSRNTLVVYGGSGGDDPSVDSFVEYGPDGTWQSVPLPMDHPLRSGRAGWRMVYDENQDRMLLLGDVDGGFEGWTRQGNGEWVTLDMGPLASVAPVFGAFATGFSPDRNVLVLSYGTFEDGELSRHTWEMDSAGAWTETETGPQTDGPTGNSQWDSTTFVPGKGLLFHVINVSTFFSVNFDYYYDAPGHWTEAPQTRPMADGSVTYSFEARRGHSMAFAPESGTMILSGGESHSDTQTADRFGWRVLEANAAASTRSGAGMACDDSGSCIQFGGANDDGGSDETWRLRDGAWTLLNPTTKPPVRRGGKLVFDPTTDTIILAGGTNESGVLGDTWSFDGDTWTQLEDLGPRAEHAMSYDPSRGGVLVFGGTDGTSSLADTLILRGNSWSLVSAASPAGPRAGHSMTNHGGNTISGPFPLSTFSGANIWVGIDDGSGPPAESGGTLTYNPRTRESVYLGPSGLWHLFFEGPMRRPREICTANDSDGDGLTGCDDSDCAFEPACRNCTLEACEPLEFTCDDGIDNDEDGLTDCDDPSCRHRHGCGG